MIDTEATGSYISASTAAKYGLKVYAKHKVTVLAKIDSLDTSGTAQAKIEVNQKNYHEVFTVAKHLVADLILGLDVLRQHHCFKLELCGEQPETVLCVGVNELVFPVMATKSRCHKLHDVAFMVSEIFRRLAEGIIQVSTSPWRAQAFFVRLVPSHER